MKLNFGKEEYLMVCECNGPSKVMALFDNNRITIDDVPLIYENEKRRTCPRCKARYKQMRDTEPEFQTLMRTRRWFFYGVKMKRPAKEGMGESDRAPYALSSPQIFDFSDSNQSNS